MHNLTSPASTMNATTEAPKLGNLVKTVTVGRRVYFRPHGRHREMLMVFDDTQACDAGVLYVWNDRMVNLEVTGPNGSKLMLTSVTFVQPCDTPPEGQSYAEWMPYQRGQS